VDKISRIPFGRTSGTLTGKNALFRPVYQNPEYHDFDKRRGSSAASA